MKKIFAYLDPFGWHQNKRQPLDIHSEEEFREILCRERARTDRTKSEFSLLVFEFEQSGNTHLETKSLANELNGRLRSTDEVGWLDRSRIGVILPDTPAEGAWRVADDISLKSCISPTILRCDVYTYPSNWLSGLKSNFRNNLPQDNSLEKNISPKSNCDHVPTMESAGSAVELKSLIGPKIPLWKRTIDIIGSLLALILLSPVFLLTASIIKVVSPGPVFFLQDRVGCRGKVFKCWKFRTMYIDSDHNKHCQHITELIKTNKPQQKLDCQDDHRIIPLGRIIRRSSIDELPQLFNILRGEMSLVGPRPDVCYSAEQYPQWYHKRFDAVPGLTGLWQVSGKNSLAFVEMIRLDIRYTKKISPLLDIWIIFKTIPVVIGLVFENATYGKSLKTFLLKK